MDARSAVLSLSGLTQFDCDLKVGGPAGWAAALELHRRAAMPALAHLPASNISVNHAAITTCSHSGATPCAEGVTHSSATHAAQTVSSTKYDHFGAGTGKCRLFG